MRRLPKGFRKDLTFVVATSFAAFAFLLWHLAYGYQLPFTGSDAMKVRVVLPTAGLLAPQARVTVAGVRVGKVLSVERSGPSAVVELGIDRDEVPRIPMDSRVALRQRTALGENYLALELGRSTRALADGGALSVQAADEYVDVDRILSVLQGETRQRARDTLRGLGGALEARGGELNRTLRGTGELFKHGPRFVSAVHPEREIVARLVRELGHLTAAVGERGSAITTIADSGLRSMRALASRDRALAQTLRQFPSTMDNVRETTELLTGVSRTATPVVADLTHVVSRLRPVVRRLRPGAQELGGVLRELDAAAPRLTRVLDTAKDASAPTTAAMPPLRKTLCQLNPMLRYLEPYLPDLTSTIVGLGSASNSYDAIGHLIRLNPVSMNENTLAGLPDSVGLAAQKLMHSGLVSPMTGRTTFNPYPEPGQIGKAKAGDGPQANGPDGLKAAGYSYPRITADC